MTKQTVLIGRAQTLALIASEQEVKHDTLDTH
jgi:hypothetical protein